MLHDNMYMSRLIMDKLIKLGLGKGIGMTRGKDPMMEVLFKGKVDIQDNPRFKKRFPYQCSSNSAISNKDSVPNPKPQEGKGGGSC